MGQILDVAIGLALIFFLFSMLVSAIQELLAAILNWRGRGWEDAMQQWLDGNRQPHRIGWLRNKFRRVRRRDLPALSVANAVLDHGAVTNLMNGERLPSYAPSESVADALIDVLRRSASDPAATMEGLAWAVERLPNDALRAQLRPIAQAAGEDVAAFRQGLMQAYDDVMDRVGGWYKRYSQAVQIVLGLAVAVVFNVDAIHIGSVLIADDAQRAALVEAAVDVAKEQQKEAAPVPAADETPLDQLTRNYEDAASTYGKIAALKLPIGWPYRPGQEWWMAILGWMLTAVALSQGAPFWFDLMGSLIRVRGAGKKPEPSTTAKVEAPAAANVHSVAVTGSVPAITPPSSDNSFELDFLSHDDIARLQGRLRVTASGVIDQATRYALRAIQRELGMVVDGRFNADLVRRLLPEHFV
jgi:hypothetical protein